MNSLVNILWESPADFCNDVDIKTVLRIVGIIVFAIKVAVPIILIVVGMLDMAKAVTAKDENEIKKAQQGLVKKAIAAVLVFLVVSIVAILMTIIGSKEYTYCMDCINHPFTKCLSNGGTTPKTNSKTDEEPGGSGGDPTHESKSITIVGSKSLLTVGEIYKLKVISNPSDAELVYKSSSDAVKVDKDGTVTGMTPGGSAVITVSLKIDPNVKSTVTINVSKNTKGYEVLPY